MSVRLLAISVGKLFATAVLLKPLLARRPPLATRVISAWLSSRVVAISTWCLPVMLVSHWPMVSMIELEGDHCLIRSPVLLLAVVDFLLFLTPWWFLIWLCLRACIFVRLRWLSTICRSAAVLEAPAVVAPKDLPFWWWWFRCKMEEWRRLVVELILTFLRVFAEVTVEVGTAPWD